jgi:hypothetical protein
MQFYVGIFESFGYSPYFFSQTCKCNFSFCCWSAVPNLQYFNTLVFLVFTHYILEYMLLIVVLHYSVYGYN